LLNSPMDKELQLRGLPVETLMDEKKNQRTTTNTYKKRGRKRRENKKVTRKGTPNEQLAGKDPCGSLSYHKN